MATLKKCFAIAIVGLVLVCLTLLLGGTALESLLPKQLRGLLTTVQLGTNSLLLLLVGVVVVVGGLRIAYYCISDRRRMAS